MFSFITTMSKISTFHTNGFIMTVRFPCANFSDEFIYWKRNGTEGGGGRIS